jgi:GNAT superfamily N-acetyltransferase
MADVASAPAEFVRLKTSAEVVPLRPLFDAMYRHFDAIAGRSLLREGGFDAWLGLYDKVADRNRMIVAARIDGAPVGFVEGLTRAPAVYAPAGLNGFVAHIYVTPEVRGTGVAQRLVADLLDWFRERTVTTVGLQVIDGNDGAVRFWRSQGFVSEFLQMRLATS